MKVVCCFCFVHRSRTVSGKVQSLAVGTFSCAFFQKRSRYFLNKEFAVQQLADITESSRSPISAEYILTDKLTLSLFEQFTATGVHGDLGVPVHNRVVEEPKRDIEPVIIPGLLMVETLALEQELKPECATRIAPVQVKKGQKLFFMFSIVH